MELLFLQKDLKTKVKVLLKSRSDNPSGNWYSQAALILAVNTLTKPHPLLDELMSKYVSYTGKPIYVNEVKDYLLSHNKPLFDKYAQQFVHCIGAKEVFGIDPVEPFSDVDEESEEAMSKEEVKPKERLYIKKRVKKRVRKEAKQRAIEKHKERLEKAKERAVKQKEFEAYVKKYSS